MTKADETTSETLDIAISRVIGEENVRMTGVIKTTPMSEVDLAVAEESLRLLGWNWRHLGAIAQQGLSVCMEVRRLRERIAKHEAECDRFRDVVEEG